MHETTTTKEVSTMSDIQDLRRRQQALETELSGLREQRERDFRAYSDAGSRQYAGATDHNAAEMEELADGETAGDSAMTELHRQIELIDDELARDHGGGFTGKGRRIMRWLRR
jgi:hypothetical protein